jgi:hypothetical protein
MINGMDHYMYYEITEEGLLSKKSIEEKLIKRAEWRLSVNPNKNAKWIKVGAIKVTNSEGKKLNGIVLQIENPDKEYHCDGSFICNLNKEVNLNKLKELIQKSEKLKKYYISNPKTYSESHTLNPGDVGGGPKEEREHANKYYKQYDVDLYSISGDPEPNPDRA